MELCRVRRMREIPCPSFVRMHQTSSLGALGQLVLVSQSGSFSLPVFASRFRYMIPRRAIDNYIYTMLHHKASRSKVYAWNLLNVDLTQENNGSCPKNNAVMSAKRCCGHVQKGCWKEGCWCKTLSTRIFHVVRVSDACVPSKIKRNWDQATHIILYPH